MIIFAVRQSVQNHIVLTSCRDFMKAGSEESDNKDQLGCKGIKDPKYTCVQSQWL